MFAGGVVKCQLAKIDQISISEMIVHQILIKMDNTKGIKYVSIKALSCKFQPLGSPKNIYHFLTTKKEPEHDLVFVRHAQSQFNVACENYRKAHKIPYVWKQLCNHEGFDQKVLFNFKYVDCPLTLKGKTDCQNKRQLYKRQEIDCILVSPLQRTLQTCREIFKGRTNIPVIVEPSLIGPIRSCSDLSLPMSKKMKQFSEFDLKKVQNLPHLWFTQYLPESQQRLVEQRLSMQNLETYQTKCRKLLELLKQGKINEDALKYRRRIEELKQCILGYKKKYQRIAIVSHYYTIQYLCAIDYMNCGSPKYYIDVKNCTPYYASSKKLVRTRKSTVHRFWYSL